MDVLDRRILATMSEAGALPGRRRLACRRIVRAVGGDEDAVYATLVRMAQGWVRRYPLIDGAGNFGSVDGDTAAEMQYTEARLAPLAVDVLRGIVPDRLINGGDGVLPHMREVAAAIVAFLDDPAIGTDALRAHVPWPDFPGGGVIRAVADLPWKGSSICATCGTNRTRPGCASSSSPGSATTQSGCSKRCSSTRRSRPSSPPTPCCRSSSRSTWTTGARAGAGDQEIRRQIVDHGDERRTAIDLRP